MANNILGFLPVQPEEEDQWEALKYAHKNGGLGRERTVKKTVRRVKEWRERERLLIMGKQM